jgi:pSer/pThr/pTyr-binding forkhead associated (FHA) protein
MFDGKPMVPAGSGPSATPARGVSTPTVQPTQSPQPLQAAQTSSSAAQPASQGTAVGDKVKLTSAMHGITIEAGDGDIIGRKNGAFVNEFGRFNYVSGTHCKIVKTPAGWHIQDMGSTNGTFYNGIKLAPNVPYPLANGATLKIADVELLISFDTSDGGTSRI